MGRIIYSLTDTQWAEVDAIDGWLFRDEAEQLYRLCDGPWIEIGSWKGKSTIVLAQRHEGWAVDWFQGSPEHPDGTDTFRDFLENTYRYGDKIHVVAGRFEDVVDKTPDEVQLIFFDAAHEYEPTKQAFDLYAHKVRSGGYIIFHDAWDEGGNMESTGPWPGVNQFVKELMEDPNWEYYETAVRNAAFKRV